MLEIIYPRTCAQFLDKGLDINSDEKAKSELSIHCDEFQHILHQKVHSDSYHDA